MSSAEYLREFVKQRLTAAAEEIFGVFEKTILEYEEEIDRQRKLLDIFWKPEIKLHNTELPQQHDCQEEEEVLTDCIQERNSSLDQEDPEPPQIKEEQEELCISQEGEQLGLKQETDTFMATHEESDHSEAQTLDFIFDDTLSAAEKESVVNIPVISSVVSTAHSDHQLLSYNFHGAESRDQKGGERGDSESTRNAESESQKRHHESQSNNVNNANLSEVNRSQEGEQLGLMQETDFLKTHLTYERKEQREDWALPLDPDRSQRAAEKEPPDHISSKRTISECDRESSVRAEQSSDHQLIFHTSHVADNQDYTSDKPFKCNSCSKDFYLYTHLKIHMTSHAADKPFSCGKGFKGHLVTHSGEKLYACSQCQRTFQRFKHLQVHIRSHTGERPYSCFYCGKALLSRSALAKHVRLHTSQKPYSCGIWGELLQ